MGKNDTVEYFWTVWFRHGLRKDNVSYKRTIYIYNITILLYQGFLFLTINLLSMSILTWSNEYLHNPKNPVLFVPRTVIFYNLSLSIRVMLTLRIRWFNCVSSKFLEKKIRKIQKIIRFRFILPRLLDHQQIPSIWGMKIELNKCSVHLMKKCTTLNFTEYHTVHCLKQGQGKICEAAVFQTARGSWQLHDLVGSKLTSVKISIRSGCEWTTSSEER